MAIGSTEQQRKFEEAKDTVRPPAQPRELEGNVEQAPHVETPAPSPITKT